MNVVITRRRAECVERGLPWLRCQFARSAILCRKHGTSKCSGARRLDVHAVPCGGARELWLCAHNATAVVELDKVGAGLAPDMAVHPVSGGNVVPLA